MSHVLFFTVGLLVGGFFGLLLASLCAIAGDADRRAQREFELFQARAHAMMDMEQFRD